MEIKTENKTGADCSGSSGDSNRVLTLSNTGSTIQNGMLVYVSGLALGLTTEYTVSHNNSSSVITFLNPLWDDMTVIVQYYQIVQGGLSTDFEKGPLSDFKIVATRTPVTVTTDFHGNKTYSDSTDENISMAWDTYNKKHDLDKAGLTKVYDVRVFIKPDVTLNKYDKITHDSKIYRVEEVSTRDFNGTTIFQVAGLFYIEDE